MTINLQQNVGPYTGVSADKTKTFKNGRTFRFIIYGAYNALGLIGSECNGVAVLDNDNRTVVCDEIAKTGSGWYGSTPDQKEAFAKLLKMGWKKFQELINKHPRTREKI